MAQTFNELQPKVVLGVAAHPDDLDFGASGTMAKFAHSGADVYYLILTDGSCGSEDRTIRPEELRDMRRQEQRNAGKIVGLADVFFCDYPDGALENSREVKCDVVKIIRQVKPDVVVAMDPSMLYSAERGFINHPDHRAAGQAALDAVFPLARDHLSFPKLLADGYEPHKTKTMLLTNFDAHNYAVDITDFLDTKFQAIAAHVSQVPKDFKPMRALFTDWAEQAGRPYGYKYAEAFMRLDIR
jgi:LmbE family N-acetylglucosaminyl deacetylase